MSETAVGLHVYPKQEMRILIQRMKHQNIKLSSSSKIHNSTCTTFVKTWPVDVIR